MPPSTTTVDGPWLRSAPDVAADLETDLDRGLTSSEVEARLGRLLWGAIALSLVLQVAVVHLPFLNSAFGTTPLGAGDWVICVGLASVVLWADESKKLLERWLLPAGSRSRRAR